MSIDTEEGVNAIAYLAQTASQPRKLDPGGYYLVHRGDGHTEIHDLTGDDFRDQPKHKAGKVYVGDVASFAFYYAKHATPDAEVFADLTERSVTAVLDAHTPTEARRQEHRLICRAKHSAAWDVWVRANESQMTQQKFAEFIEDNRLDIAEPSGSDMLEMAQTLQGTTEVVWDAKVKLSNGSRSFTYTENTNGTAGNMAIPEQITLRLPVFQGGDLIEMTARFRYQLRNGQLWLSYKLDRPGDVVAEAFAAILADISEKTGATVLLGTPA